MEDLTLPEVDFPLKALGLMIHPQIPSRPVTERVPDQFTARREEAPTRRRIRRAQPKAAPAPKSGMGEGTKV